MKTYTNGNRKITVEKLDCYVVTSDVWDGTKWQYGRPRYFLKRPQVVFAQLQNQNRRKG